MTNAIDRAAYRLLVIAVGFGVAGSYAWFLQDRPRLAVLVALGALVCAIGVRMQGAVVYDSQSP